jgi:hypothetical protein
MSGACTPTEGSAENEGRLRPRPVGTMRFSVLALDYDGTIADGGTLCPEARAAIEDVRRRGIAVVLVTGRILDELEKAQGTSACSMQWWRRAGRRWRFPGAAGSSLWPTRHPLSGSARSCGSWTSPSSSSSTAAD